MIGRGSVWDGTGSISVMVNSQLPDLLVRSIAHGAPACPVGKWEGSILNLETCTAHLGMRSTRFQIENCWERTMASRGKDLRNIRRTHRWVLFIQETIHGALGIRRIVSRSFAPTLFHDRRATGRKFTAGRFAILHGFDLDARLRASSYQWTAAEILLVKRDLPSLVVIMRHQGHIKERHPSPRVNLTTRKHPKMSVLSTSKESAFLIQMIKLLDTI